MKRLLSALLLSAIAGSATPQATSCLSISGSLVTINGSAVCNVTIALPLTISTTSLSAATQYAAFSQPLAAAGGSPPYTWSLTTNGTMNTWAVSSVGVLSGAPNIPIPDYLTFQVADSNGKTASITLPTTVNYVVPAGAQALGYTKLQWILLNPNLSQINPGPYASTVKNYLYNGDWPYSPVGPFSLYSMVNGVLTISFTGAGSASNLGTQNTNGSGPPAAGYLGWLTNSTGWYTEAGLVQSSNTTDAWPAYYMISTENNNASTAGVINPAQVSLGKQFLEVDAWEGGNTPGYYGAIVYHSVSGSSNHQNASFTQPDMTKPQVFGVSWNPNGTSAWWLNNKANGTRSILDAGTGAVTNATSLAWLNTQHMYGIVDTNTHGANTPFTEGVLYLAAWGPPLTAAAPAFSPVGGTYTSAQTVSMTDSTPGASIYYTVNGTTPTTSSTLYSAPITVSSTETVKAIAAVTGFSNSAVTSATYTIASTGALFLPAVLNASANWAASGTLPIGGIPNRTVQCGATVQMTNSVIFGAGDDKANIQAAVNACPAGQFVQLAAGVTSTANITLSGTALTVNSGTVAVGNALLGAGLYPGETVTSISGSTGTVSMPPLQGNSVTNETVTVSTQFNFGLNEHVLVNKGVSIRGTGACTTGNVMQSVCPTIVNSYAGALPDWAIPGLASGKCGVSVNAAVNCSQAQGLFYLSAGDTYTMGWGGCAIDGVNPTTKNCGTTLTADAAQGATTVSVSSTANFIAGMWVLIDEDPQVTALPNPICPGGGAQCTATVSASPEWLNATLSGVALIAGGDEPGNYSYIGAGNSNRANQEIHQIASVGVGKLTFTTPLMLAFRQSGSHDARVYWPTLNGAVTNFAFQAGLENLSITRGGGNGGNVEIEFCAYCWVWNVDIGGWIAGAINVVDSANDEINTDYVHLGYNLQNNGSEYPIGISERSTGILVVNNIDLWGGKGMVGRGANGNVVAYNYVDMTFYETFCNSSSSCTIGDSWQELGANASHYAAPSHWLFESNWTPNCDADNTHGNAFMQFFFRNDCAGIRSQLTDFSINKTVNDATGTAWVATFPYPGSSANAPGLLRAAGPMAWNYWFAFAGNVFGTAGVTTTANGWIFQGNGNIGPGQTNKMIRAGGWVGGGNKNADPNLNGVNGTQFVFYNGNFDYVHGSVPDNASGYSQSFPASFYLTSKPSFFTGAHCNYAWPAVVPTASTPLVLPTGTGCTATEWLPAKERWAVGAPLGPQP